MSEQKPSILVTALNPSIDVEWRVSTVHWEEKNTILSERRWAGGKGVNVARWIRHLGGEPALLLPLGGQNGKELLQGLEIENLPVRPIQLEQETRANIIVTTSAGRQLRFNPAGPDLSSDSWKKLRVALGRELKTVSLAVFSGSQPRGVSASGYRELVSIAQRQGIRCILDCDGAPFAEGLRAKPFLVKPNAYELGQWGGRILRTRHDIRAMARRLAKATGNWVFVSLGKAGALLLNARGDYFEARAPKVAEVNTVGAGDATVAGVALAISQQCSPEEWLKAGVSCGSAAVEYPAGVIAPLRKIRGLNRKIIVSQSAERKL